MNEKSDQDVNREDAYGHADDAVIGRALKWSLCIGLLILLTTGSIVWILNRPKLDSPNLEAKLILPELRTNHVVQVPVIPFTNITQRSGISFYHENGALGQKLLPETMGGGCAFLDYDGDGDQDLLLVNSSHWPNNEYSDHVTSALYANDGSGKFTDVTDDAGMNLICYGMGVAVGDYDNDGDPDVFISTVGKNILLRNDGGQFVDVTDVAGVAGDPSAWSTSCGWFDYDNDGDLDLLVGNYVQWSPEIDLAQDFRLTGLGRAYGPPFSFQGTFPYLYRNEGNGDFSDVSKSSMIQITNTATGVPLAKTLGVALLDANHDGWMDFILANDTVQNQLLVNQHDGTFQDVAVEAGIAFDASGKARGAMGIDTGCFRNDDCLGVAIGNFANEMSALYVSAGNDVTFTDDAIPCGLGPQTRSDLCFGLFFFDADLDGRLDIFAANGHLEKDINLVQKSQYYQQPPRLFWNAGLEGTTEFLAVSNEKPSELAEPLVGRGAAYADIDSDGDLDVVVTQIGDRPAVLRNDQKTGNHYLRFKLIGTLCNHDAIGSWIEVHQGEKVVRREVMPTRSYLSQVELPVTIGIGQETEVDRVVIRWADGSEQEIQHPAIDQTLVIEQNGAPSE